MTEAAQARTPHAGTTPTNDTRTGTLPTETRGRRVRLALFRVAMSLVALVYLVGFGAWRAILTPWVGTVDGVDHGWERTPELHRLADSSAGMLFVALGTSALVLAVKPRRMSGLVAWLAAAVTVTGGFSWLSALIQGHDEVMSAAVFSLVWVALAAAIFLWLNPEGRAVLRGGERDVAGPPRGIRVLLHSMAGTGLLVAVGTIGWRLAGGVFESPLEDDVFSLTYAGLLWALGGLLAGQGRAGWRALTAILLAGCAYAVVGGVTLALA